MKIPLSQVKVMILEAESTFTTMLVNDNNLSKKDGSKRMKEIKKALKGNNIHSLYNGLNLVGFDTKDANRYILDLLIDYKK